MGDCCLPSGVSSRGDGASVRRLASKRLRELRDLSRVYQYVASQGEDGREDRGLVVCVRCRGVDDRDLLFQWRE